VRLQTLGARAPHITGNMKFDMAVAPALIELGHAWRARIAGTRKVLTLAVTREGEEPLLLAAYARMFDAAARARCLLVIVPRHPQRFDEVAGAAAHCGLRVARRSRPGAQDGACEVWIGDSMREMPAYYAMSDVAIIGGSFMPLGGQNLIEAASVGCPALIGPHVFNFSEAVRLGVAAGAVNQLVDADTAMKRARTLLEDDAQRAHMAAAASAFAAAHRGATERTLALIEPGA
jgi:3-deoxy-D-manno-octulosonic-acid transferase